MHQLVSWLAVAAVLYYAAAPPALSAQADTMLHRLLTEHSHPVQLTAGVPGGPGWELLLREGRRADFFMLGEVHGVGTIPVLTRHLFTQLVPAGYERLVIEVSPRQARELEQRIRAEPDAVVPWAMRQGLRIPFYSWKEEVELLRAAVAAVPNARSVLWGLDQEFVGSSESAFVRLGQLARTSEQRRITEEFRQRAERGFAGMSGGKEPRFMASADTAAFARLRRAFAGNVEALELVGELERSAEIYQLWRGRQVYRSNDIRERLMKRNFMGHLNRLELRDGKAPKMLFKFGGDHLFRGQKETKNLSLGNFLSELAIARGKESFNVLALPGAGSWRERPQSGQPERVPNDGLASDGLEPLRKHIGTNGWTVIDLRPLRDPLLQKQIRVPDEFARMIWGYDAVIVLPSSPPTTSAPQATASANS